MRRSTRLWLLAICTAAAVSEGVTAQVQVQPFPSDPRILSGDDIGFRVDGQRRDSRMDRQTGRSAPVTILTGRLMVRVNGQWVEAEMSAAGIRPATE